MGFLQFIAPSLQFLLAVVVYGEAFTPAHQIAFGCIWTALIIYSVDTATFTATLLGNVTGGKSVSDIEAIFSSSPDAGRSSWLIGAY